MKQQKSEAVIHDWVCELPFMQQALLMTAMRGPDGCSKYNSAKIMVQYLRGVVLKPAEDIKGNEDTFMWVDFEHFEEHFKVFFKDTDGYPMHFLMHLIHAAEVVGYNHPEVRIKELWFRFYIKSCKSFHMNIESKEQMDKRMSL